MNKIKNAYFQGGGAENEPTPKKKKYKDKPVDQDLTKARGVLFRNYDLYDTGGPGPGAGLYQHMDEYDSVQDFRKKKKKENNLKRRKAMFESLMTTANSSFDIIKLAQNYQTLKEFDDVILVVSQRNADYGSGFYDKEINDKNDLAGPEDEDGSPTPIVWNSAETGSPIGMLDGVTQDADEEGTPFGNIYYGKNEMHRVEAQKK